MKKEMNNNNEEQIVNCIMMWMVFLGIIFAASILGMAVTIIESISTILK
jgi:hypothetical protein